MAKKHELIGMLLLLIAGLFTISAVAEEAEYFDMSLEELMEVSTVVSSSRQEQKVTETSIPVTIITAEDIHYSGATNVPEILRFASGVDVLQLDRNTYAVGIRGFHGFLSDRVLVLINGRILNNALYGAMEWNNFPVLIEDIQRIEIVRGPASASWGANAFNGVINVITKKPKDVTGTFVSTTITEYGDSYTHLRLAGVKNKWDWKLSVGYEDRKDSDKAGAGRFQSSAPAYNAFIGFGGFEARDFSRNWRFNSEAIYNMSPDTKWSFGLGYSYIEAGDRESGGYFPARDALTSVWRIFARVDHEFDDDSSFYLQWFNNVEQTHVPYGFEKYTTNEHDLETQWNFIVGDKHHISVGGNLRWTRLHTAHTITPNQVNIQLIGSPFNEFTAGAFLIDRFEMTERLTIEGQIRLDKYWPVQTDWSARLTAIYALDDEADHVVRASVARAYRSPLVVFRQLRSSTIYFMGTPLLNVFPNTKLKNESIKSIEVGYHGKIAKNMTLSIDAYLQKMENLIGSINTMAGPVVNAQFVNGKGATAHGIETELTIKAKNSQLSIWYNYHDLRTDQSHQSIRAFYPSKHKFGFTHRQFFGQGWTLNTNYVYNNKINSYGNGFVAIPTNSRLDVNVSKKFNDGKGEFMVGVSNVLNHTNFAVTSISSLTNQETPGRTFFARIQWTF